MFRNSLVVAGLALVSALAGLAPTADAQARRPDFDRESAVAGEPVKILELQRLVDERADQLKDDLVEEAVDRFRLVLDFQLPSGGAVDQSTVILEGSAMDGTSMATRAIVTGAQRHVELALRKPRGAEFKAFRISVQSKGNAGSARNLLWMAERTINAEQVKKVPDHVGLRDQ